MRKQFIFFIVRWLLVSLGLWVASRLLGSSFQDTNASTSTFLLAGLVLSLVNTLLKPVIVVLSLPAILVTLGLFMLVVNGTMVYVALKLVPGLEVSFWGAVLTGMIISLINYIMTGIIDYKDKFEESTIT
ncbi:MAG TPA: phage holin family protein [Candidatus Saccharibacteria bacterium]|nr:phage holin family protein [Candidatus Saccharibacteria bacterium]